MECRPRSLRMQKALFALPSCLLFVLNCNQMCRPRSCDVVVNVLLSKPIRIEAQIPHLLKIIPLNFLIVRGHPQAAACESISLTRVGRRPTPQVAAANFAILATCPAITETSVNC